MVHVLSQKDFAVFLYVLLFEFIEKPFLVLTDYFENVMLYLAIRDDRKLRILNAIGTELKSHIVSGQAGLLTILDHYFAVIDYCQGLAVY